VDEITSKIVAKVAGGYGVIETAETKSATQKSPNDVQARDLVLQAREAVKFGWNHDTFSTAHKLLRQAIALDPLNAQARRELAWLAVFNTVFHYVDMQMSLDEIEEQAGRAVQLDNADARAHMVLACAYFFQAKDKKDKLALFDLEADEAMNLDPDNPDILATLGALIANTGQWQRGVGLVEKAHDLNPEAALGWYDSTMYLNDYMNGDYESALRRAVQNEDKESLYVFIDFIAILGQLGRKDQALENWHKLLKERPGWSVESFEDWYRTWNFRDEDIAKLMDGIHKSGVPGLEARVPPVAQDDHTEPAVDHKSQVLGVGQKLSQ
jgi:tetratricopeptide (TPR) repeat protein